MKRNPIPKRLLFALTGLGLVLPMAISVVLGLAAVLPAMGDPLGSAVLKWIGLGLAIFWTVDLVCLVFTQAICRLADEEEDQDSS